MKLCGIYCIENIKNHKKYIGLSRDIHRRWDEHISELNRNSHTNQYLQRAWNKDGKENFIFNIIEICNEKELSYKERYYINLYKSMSHENGYNLTSGGENNSGGRLIVELKTKHVYGSVREAAKNEGVVPLTMIDWCKKKQNYMYLDEFKLLSNEEKEYWTNFDWDEYKHNKLSQAHSRENLSESAINNYRRSTSGCNNPRAFKVYCPELDEEFECAKYAHDKYGVNVGSISQCIRGKLKSAGIHPITGEKLTWIKI